MPFLQRYRSGPALSRPGEVPGAYLDPRPRNLGDAADIDEAQPRLPQNGTPFDRNRASHEDYAARSCLSLSVSHDHFSRCAGSGIKDANLQGDSGGLSATLNAAKARKRTTPKDPGYRAPRYRTWLRRPVA
jgi:hypothetical protein